MGAILYVSAQANEYKSDEHCFTKDLPYEDIHNDKSLVERTEKKLIELAKRKGEVSAIYIPVFDSGARFYSDLLEKKPRRERCTDMRINKLFQRIDSAQIKLPGVSFPVFSLTINGREYSLKSMLTRIELPAGEYDITLNTVYEYHMDTYNGKSIDEKLKLKKSVHVSLEEGYNFLQVRGTVYFESYRYGSNPRNHYTTIYVFEVPTRLDFNMRPVSYDNFNADLSGNEYDIPYPGNKYFKYGFEKDTLLTNEEREAELKKARLFLSGRGAGAAVKPSDTADNCKKPDSVAINKSTAATEEKQSDKPSVENKPQSKPDRVGIYGRDSQLSKAMQILNDSSKEAVDELNASYNELMAVLRSNKPKYTPPPTPKKPTPEEEAYARRVDEFWAADKRAYEERIKAEEEKNRKREAELEAESLRKENAEKAKLEAAERRKRFEAEEREIQHKKAEEERKERDRREKEERLSRIAAEKNTPKATPDIEKENELLLKYKDIFSFKGTTLLEYKGSSPNVTVPDFVKRIDFKFFHNKNIKSVKIEADISSLSERMFSNTDIEEVTLPKSVKRIEKQCFKGCRSLRKISGGENISFIGEEAFMGCEALASLDIHTSLISLDLGKSCFKDCKSLKSIFIKCAELPEGCFENCGSLKTAYLKDTKTVGKNAFYNCSSLVKLGIDAIMKSDNEKVGANIKESAFEKCRALKSIEVPSKTVLIENRAFADCDSLSLVHFSYDPTASERGDITGKCDFVKVFSDCPSLKKIIYKGDKNAVKSLDPSGKCPFKIKNKLKDKDLK